MRPMMNRDGLTPIENEKCTEKYVPRRSECLTEYEINIKFLSVGCVIRVGCKEIAFHDIDEGIKELNRYLNDPYTVKEEWYRKFDNMK